MPRHPTPGEGQLGDHKESVIAAVQGRLELPNSTTIKTMSLLDRDILENVDGHELREFWMLAVDWILSANAE
jgi:hypothetical protein